jgi:putative membrane protein
MTSPRDTDGPAQPPTPAAGQVTTPAVEGAAAAEAPPAQPAPPVRQHVVHRTRVGGLWVGLALSAVVLLLLLVFILENGQKANIGYFGAHGQLPLGVALLLAAVAGALLVIIPGTGRILQLRRTARRHRALDAKRQPAAPAPSAPAAPAGPADDPGAPAV